MGSFNSEGTNPRYKMNKFWESNVQHGDCRYQSCVIGLLATEMGLSLGRQWGVLLWNSDTCNLKNLTAFSCSDAKTFSAECEKVTKSLKSFFFFLNGNDLSLLPVLGVGESKVEGGHWKRRLGN